MWLLWLNFVTIFLGLHSSSTKWLDFFYQYQFPCNSVMKSSEVFSFFFFFFKHWPLKIHLTALLRHSMFYYLCNRISSLFNSNDLTGYEIFRSSLITHNFSLSSLLILLFYLLNLLFFPFFSPFFSQYYSPFLTLSLSRPSLIIIPLFPFHSHFIHH